MLVVLALRWLRQDDPKFEASPEYIVRFKFSSHFNMDAMEHTHPHRYTQTNKCKTCQIMRRAFKLISSTRLIMRNVIMTQVTNVNNLPYI